MELTYDLGEMKGESGEGLRYEAKELASNLAHELCGIIQKYSIYINISDAIGNLKTAVYFEKALKEEICPIITRLCVLRCQKRNGTKHNSGDRKIMLPKVGIYPLLEKVWPDTEYPVEFLRSSFNKQYFQYIKKQYLRPYLRYKIDSLSQQYSKLKISDSTAFFQNITQTIALQYAEGLDLHKRSDIIWFPESGIDPQHILVYFEMKDIATGKPIAESVLKSIEEMGMKWVCLKKGVLERKDVKVWCPPLNYNKGLTIPDVKPQNQVERWIAGKGIQLLNEVNYWAAFYEAFNIRINFVIGENSPTYLARSIAFDTHGSQYGLMAGKQRSVLYLPPKTRIGHYPSDVFFTWSDRSEKYLSPNINRIKSIVAAGYPNDVIFNSRRSHANKLRTELRSKGVTYIVALFDNVYSPDYELSSTMMETFYLKFLNWLFESPTLGIVIKSKKPQVLNGLPRVLSLLAKAEATGRCVRLSNEYGRMPVDASMASDISVGIGISSAVIESAIAGCRSIHCDLTHLRSQEFYQWGYERIIFDDLDRLIAALKHQKSDRRSYQELGDWTPFQDRLDPFRDGRAGERMGRYLRWCLEGFDAGLDRNEVIRKANEEYNKHWGADKTALLPLFL